MKRIFNITFERTNDIFNTCSYYIGALLAFETIFFINVKYTHTVLSK